MKIAQLDVFSPRLQRHHRVGGHATIPARLPDTDYYIEPQSLHA